MLEEDPTAEDVLCRLMILLHQQGMGHQAFHVYHRAVEAYAQDELDLTEATKTLVFQLQNAHHHPLRGRSLAEQVTSSHPAFFLPSQQNTPLFAISPTVPHDIIETVHVLSTIKQCLGK